MPAWHFRSAAHDGIQWSPITRVAETAMSSVATVAEVRTLSARLRAVAGLPLRAFEAFMAWRRHREGVRLLLELDDRLLRDAGFIRRELERLR